jgi:hypothetical protein
MSCECQNPVLFDFVCPCCKERFVIEVQANASTIFLKPWAKTHFPDGAAPVGTDDILMLHGEQIRTGEAGLLVSLGVEKLHEVPPQPTAIVRHDSPHQ